MVLFQPLEYKVHLEPNLDPDSDFTTGGMMIMNFKVVDNTNDNLNNKVVIHAINL